MKKIFLSLAFVLATSSLLNANSINDNEQKSVFNDCDAVYFAVRDAVIGVTGDLILGITAAIRAEEACLEANEELTLLVD
jgi:hypothetical protein